MPLLSLNATVPLHALHGREEETERDLATLARHFPPDGGPSTESSGEMPFLIFTVTWSMHGRAVVGLHMTFLLDLLVADPASAERCLQACRTKLPSLSVEMIGALAHGATTLTFDTTAIAKGCGFRDMRPSAHTLLDWTARAVHALSGQDSDGTGPALRTPDRDALIRALHPLPAPQGRVFADRDGPPFPADPICLP